MELKVYYSIQNCGDGSASIEWFESEELASWDQETQNEDEGWAEDCSGYITISGDNLVFKEDIIGKETLLAEYVIEDLEDALELFKKKFYPTKEYPVFDVVLKPEQRYYFIYVNGKEVNKSFAYPEEIPTLEIAGELKTKLNSL